MKRIFQSCLAAPESIENTCLNSPFTTANAPIRQIRSLIPIPTKLPTIIEESTQTTVPCTNCKRSRRLRLRKKRILEKLGPQVERNDVLYLFHIKQLRNATKKVDNTTPMVSVRNLMQSARMRLDLDRLQQINAENKQLLGRINKIQRTKGSVDCYNPNAGARKPKRYVTNNHLSPDYIDKDNRKIYESLKRAESKYKTSELLHDWKTNRATIEKRSRYPLILPGLCPLKYETECDCMDKSRPKVFIEFAFANGRWLGRIVVLLYPDIVPKTAANFIELVKNYADEQDKRLPATEKCCRCGKIKTRKTQMHYVGTPVCRIYQRLFLEMGSLATRSTEAEFEFLEENFILQASHPGMLAMIPDAKGMVNSRFLITVKPLKVLNGQFVMFGRIVKGIDVIEMMEKMSRVGGSPIEAIVISNCGLLRRSSVVA